MAANLVSSLLRDDISGGVSKLIGRIVKRTLISNQWKYFSSFTWKQILEDDMLQE
jgi:hypothetical protein